MQSWSTYFTKYLLGSSQVKRDNAYTEQRKWLSMTSFIEFINTSISVG